MRSAYIYAIFMFHNEAIHLQQIVTLRGCERMAAQRGTKVAPWIHDASTVAAAVGEKAHLRVKRRWLVKKSSL